MGRKPKNADYSRKEESVNPVNEESREAETEMDNPCLASLKKKRTQDDLGEQEANHSKLVPCKNIVKNAPFGVRRSSRLQEAVVATENYHIEQIIEEITVSESEKEKDVYEKIDNIVELLQAQQKATHEINSMRIGESSSSVGKGKYKNLYFRSQKKIEALMEENDELTKKLENAYGIIEFYKKRAEEMVEKGKETDATLLRSRATEAAAFECETGKRKRGPN